MRYEVTVESCDTLISSFSYPSLQDATNQFYHLISCRDFLFSNSSKDLHLSLYRRDKNNYFLLNTKVFQKAN